MQDQYPQHEDAEGKTCEEILREEIYALIELGYQHGILDEGIVRILEGILDDEAERHRRKFKLL